jgi:hypothetical protein
LKDISKDKKPSANFIKMVEEWADSYIKSTELPIKIMQEAKMEDLSNAVVRQTIEDALRHRGLSDRRILQLLPSELKNSSKTREKIKEFAATIAANPIDPKSERSTDEFNPNINEENVPITTIDKPLLKNSPPVETQTEPDYEAEYRKETEGKINSLDTEPPFRLAILDTEKSTAEFMRQISKLKGRGWKIIEVQVRYIS